MSNIITSSGHDSGEAPTEPAATASVAPPPLTGFAAGITGAVLLIAGVWGLHVISRAGGFTVSAGSVLLLLAAFTALGKGITLLQRALGPILAAAAMAVSGVPALLRAVTAIIVGATGVWWVLRGHAATWWAHTTGTSASWTLASALVQVALIAVAGALLFGGARTLAAALGLHIQRGDRWTAWWSSRPGLGLMLLTGAAAIVALSGYIVPQVARWLAGGDPQAVLVAIAVILIAGLLANTWWWGALTGWWKWAHRPHTPGGGATPMGQMYAGAGVVALLWLSATAFGLAVPDSYTGPGAMPRARADCPPDCGGGNGGSNSFGPNGSQFQPPQMPDPPGQYQSGANSYPGMDQNNGISLYNPGAGQGSEPAQGGYATQGQPGPPANGVQPPNYDAPLQPQASAPQQGSVGPQQPSPGAQQGPGQQSLQAPQQPVQQAPAQQGPQQQPAQQPQGRPQPGQPNQPPQQGQPDQQPQNSTGQQQTRVQQGQQNQQSNNQQEQLKQKEADKLRKKLQDQLNQDSDTSDDDDNDDGRSDPTTLAIAATQRRKSLLDRGKEIVDKQIERAPKYAIQGASAGVNALLKRNLNVSQAALSESERLVEASSNVINDSIRAGSRVTTADPAIDAALNTVRSESTKIPGLVSKVGNLGTITKILGKGTGPALAPLAAYFDIKDGMDPGKALAANAASAGAAFLAGAAMAALTPAAPAVAVVVVGAAVGVAAYQGVKWAYSKLPEGTQQAIDSGLRAAGDAAKEAGKSVVNAGKSLVSGIEGLFS